MIDINYTPSQFACGAQARRSTFCWDWWIWVYAGGPGWCYRRGGPKYVQ